MLMLELIVLTTHRQITLDDDVDILIRHHGEHLLDAMLIIDGERIGLSEEDVDLVTSIGEVHGVLLFEMGRLGSRLVLSYTNHYTTR